MQYLPSPTLPSLPPSVVGWGMAPAHHPVSLLFSGHLSCIPASNCVSCSLGVHAPKGQPTPQRSWFFFIIVSIVRLIDFPPSWIFKWVFFCRISLSWPGKKAVLDPAHACKKHSRMAWAEINHPQTWHTNQYLQYGVAYKLLASPIT